MPVLLPKEVIADHLGVTKYKRLFFRRNEPDLHTSSSSESKISIIQSVKVFPFLIMKTLFSVSNSIQLSHKNQIYSRHAFRC